MSNFFSRLYSGAVADFQTAKTELTSLWAKVSAIPGVKPVEEAVQSAVLQQVSNAFAFVDTELKPHYADAISMVESAIDTGLLAFGSASLGPEGGIIVKVATPAVNGGATLFFNQLRAVIDHAEADFKANANLPPPTADAAPTVAGVVNAIGQAAGLAPAPQAEAA